MVDVIEQWERVSYRVDGGDVFEAEPLCDLSHRPLTRDEHVLVEKLTEHVQRTV